MRDDVAKFLEASKPTFLRMPGGNNMYVRPSFVSTAANICSEGLSIPKRWIWNNTIGPTVERPGRDGSPLSNGLGWLLITLLQVIGSIPIRMP